MITKTASHDVRDHILESGQAIISGRGFSAVGLNQILRAANVPKGSFYHYFGSKEAFGEALLERYFDAYLESLKTLLSGPGVPGAQRLMRYWETWLETQSAGDPMGKCLVVKLAAEVSDLSETMRGVLHKGTNRVIAQLQQTVEESIADNSLSAQVDAGILAATLYQLWLGASLRAKITHNTEPMASALIATRDLLGLPINNA